MIAQDDHDGCPFCNPQEISLGVALTEEGDMLLLVDGFPVPLSIESAERLAVGFKEAADWYRWLQEVRSEPPV